MTTGVTTGYGVDKEPWTVNAAIYVMNKFHSVLAVGTVLTGL